MFAVRTSRVELCYESADWRSLSRCCPTSDDPCHLDECFRRAPRSPSASHRVGTNRVRCYPARSETMRVRSGLESGQPFVPSRLPSYQWRRAKLLFGASHPHLALVRSEIPTPPSRRSRALACVNDDESDSEASRLAFSSSLRRGTATRGRREACPADICSPRLSFQDEHPRLARLPRCGQAPWRTLFSRKKRPLRRVVRNGGPLLE